MEQENKSPLKAIRQFCLYCMGDNASDVRNCSSKICPLKPFRFGKNPFTKREMSEERREQARVRLAEYRKQKNG